jgi:outer membrane protein TolC
MTDASDNRRWVRLFLLCLAGGFMTLAGCGPKNYKQDADERVYKIIDEKWEPQFGPKTNYRISDVPADPDAIQITRSVPSSGVVSLPNAVALATAYNREYQTQRDALYLSALNQRLVRHGYETRLFGGGSGMYERNDRDEAVEVAANVGFNRLLATGTQIGLQVGLAWLNILAGTGNSGLAGVFSGTVTQPLLRGSDPLIVMEKLTQAERDTLYQIRTFNRFRQQFVVSVVSQYYEVVELLVLARNAQDHYDALTQLERRVTGLTDAAILPLHELDEVRQDRFGALDARIQAQEAYEQALDEFKLTLALPATVEFSLDVAVIDAISKDGIPTPEFSLNDVIETALVRRLDLVNLADAVIDGQRHVYVAADQLRAELNLTATADLPAWDAANERATAGATVNLPFDRVPEQHAYRTAMVVAAQARRDYDLAIDTVSLEVRRAHRNLVEAAQRYDVASKELLLAQERIDRTTVLMQYGRASSRRVLDALDALYGAKDNATQALVNYAIAVLEFYRDSGVMQVRPDGMWQTEPLPVPVARAESAVDTPTSP